MSLASIALVLVTAAAADAPPAGTVLTYKGTMVAAKEDGTSSKKTVELNVLVAATEADGAARLL